MFYRCWATVCRRENDVADIVADDIVADNNNVL